ncbi:DUF2946 domain-containing protein [Pseudomonas solani]|uniref:DUF2946 domain-containing protein n=1 Tax=Pseudomonas solani TaxID=2731552 RepID=UPI003C2DCFA8
MARHTTNRSGAWLGLLAMLLVFAGPLLSQARSLDRQGVPDWMGELACSAEHGTVQKAPGQLDHEAAWAKCGYCTLLLNCPALSSAPLIASTLLDAVRAPRLVPVASGHAGSAIFPGSRSRAPPASLA